MSVEWIYPRIYVNNTNILIYLYDDYAMNMNAVNVVGSSTNQPTGVMILTLITLITIQLQSMHTCLSTYLPIP